MSHSPHDICSHRKNAPHKGLEFVETMHGDPPPLSPNFIMSEAVVLLLPSLEESGRQVANS